MAILETIISLIAPHDCLGCGQEGSLLCTGCLLDLPALPERCYRCSALSRGSAVCARCGRHSPLRHVWVRTQYDGLAKDLVYRLKFDRAQAASRPIAQLMQEALPYLPPTTIVVAVPTATSRVRARGYDHAELIAKQLAVRLELKQHRLLARLGQSRQVGATKAIRQRQLTDAFRPINPSKIASAHILLVDDIVTTGATFEAAARVLKKAGATSIDAVVFAQKQ